MYCILTVAFTMGLRFGELVALKWNDVNLKERTLNIDEAVKQTGSAIYIDTELKTAGSRAKVSMFPSTVEALSLQLQNLIDKGLPHGMDDLVFPSERGTFLRNQNLNKRLKRLCKEVGLPDKGWHAARHSHASWLAEEGAPAPEIKQRLRHQSIQTTFDIYADELSGLDQKFVAEVGHKFPTGDVAK